MRRIGAINDQERTKPSSRASRIAPAAAPMTRFRERAEALAFSAMSASASAVVLLERAVAAC
jgi:hypothetical protein